MLSITITEGWTPPPRNCTRRSQTCVSTDGAHLLTQCIANFPFDRISVADGQFFDAYLNNLLMEVEIRRLIRTEGRPYVAPLERLRGVLIFETGCDLNP